MAWWTARVTVLPLASAPNRQQRRSQEAHRVLGGVVVMEAMVVKVILGPYITEYVVRNDCYQVQLRLFTWSAGKGLEN
ncbi:hypothetical protein CC80DRAFT_562030 [Byssothecium circinans]|uniref:Uncharacterized protein n=1 Tax=Byssothecium circinans TaxID=147558 RepID=A0A6A5U5V6_9PLEO|nr:hypothetical protein CC80DRAFT_562030 [Byssothecium circinans]